MIPSSIAAVMVTAVIVARAGEGILLAKADLASVKADSSAAMTVAAMVIVVAIVAVLGSVLLRIEGSIAALREGSALPAALRARARDLTNALLRIEASIALRNALR